MWGIDVRGDDLVKLCTMSFPGMAVPMYGGGSD